MNGAKVLLLVNAGTDVAPDWVAVGSQTNVTFEETNESIDESSKDSRARRVDYGRYSSTVSLEHLYVPSDEGYQALKAASRDGNKIKVRRQESGLSIEEADAVITSISEAMPDQDAVTVSVDLDIDGEWVEVGS